MVTINNARKILQRVDTLPLYLHAYAFHLNMRLERMLPADLLDIASENKEEECRHVVESFLRYLLSP